MSAWKRARLRATGDEVWWQDLQPGFASSNVSGVDDGDEYYAAMLYLPDPSSPPMWTTHGVDKPKQDVPPKLYGFRGKE